MIDMKRLEIAVLNNNIRDAAELTLSNHCIEFKYQDLFIKKEEAGRSPFYLLKQIRQDLEPHGIILLCKGSRYDVDARGMHGTYILKLGMPVQTSDKVYNIFEPADESDMDKIKTVKEQSDYKKLWISTFSSI